MPKITYGGSVIAVKRLRWDLLALGNLMASVVPPLRLVRGKKLMLVRYGFGDASGSGFGASWKENDDGILYRHGVWGTDVSTKSSNFRELKNLVDAIDAMSQTESLVGFESPGRFPRSPQ